MNRDNRKELNAENYPASVLSWLHKITDEIYDDFESRTCESCKWNNGCQVVIACEDWNLPYKEANLKCDKWESKDEA